MSYPKPPRPMKTNIYYPTSNSAVFLYYAAELLLPGKTHDEVAKCLGTASLHLEKMRANMNTYHDYSSRHGSCLRSEAHHHIYAYYAYQCSKAVAGWLMLNDDEPSLNTFRRFWRINREVELTRQQLDGNRRHDERMLIHSA